MYPNFVLDRLRKSHLMRVDDATVIQMVVGATSTSHAEPSTPPVLETPADTLAEAPAEASANEVVAPCPGFEAPLPCEIQGSRADGSHSASEETSPPTHHLAEVAIPAAETSGDELASSPVES